MLAAAVVVDELCALGVREAVLCPGSRSAPVAYALHNADAEGRLRLHVRIDERTAAFLALGLAKGSATPVPVVTTSGTAAGNLLPALMEADHAGIPLLALTADRPASLVGTGANQTADQVGMFGGVVRARTRVVAAEAVPAGWRSALRRVVTAARGTWSRDPGPVHINLELADPLFGEVPQPPTGTAFTIDPPAAPQQVPLVAGPRTVVVAGDLSPAAGREIARAAAEAGVPLLAEPSSNARGGSTAMTHYRLILPTLVGEIERVVVVGHPTLSRPVSTLLARSSVDIVAVVQGARWVDPGWAVSRVVPAVDLPIGDPAWLDRWLRADAAAAAGRTRAIGAQFTGIDLAAAVVASAPGPLVLGSSNPVRDADLAPARARWPDTYANRGLAGIDGTVSTAMGVALATGQPTTALMGDLTFLHDASALVVPRSEPSPHLRIVVADDGGGSIFALLEHGAPERAESFERVFATPPGVDVASVARGYGVHVTEVADRVAVNEALARPLQGIEVIVARIDRTDRRAQAERLRGLG
jgi:2-succinyl-5-enolpyruvyl-6-hydroxy-3-cyclohexene-1-carboxylate synthase